MSTVAKRTSNPMSDMLEWLESNSPFNVRGMGLAPYVRVEDYYEDDAYGVLEVRVPTGGEVPSPVRIPIQRNE
jgi:HSP20 family protein